MIFFKVRRGAAAGIIFFTAIASVSAVTPKHGWLQTRGAYLLNEKGNIVQLKGMSFYWSTESWPGYKYYNAGTVNSLVDSWKCTVVRAAYDRSSGWSGVKAVIDAAIAKGIYVIIDWHCHDAHNNPSQGISFFTEQANAYKNTPNVIFEPYNEPIIAGQATANDGSLANAQKTWDAIKSYLTDVTKAIRTTGSKNLIILGTPYYCQHVGIAAGDQVVAGDGKPFENVAYAFHFYAASHGPNAYYVERDGGGMEATYIDAAKTLIPLFVTEWGTTHRDGGEGGTNSYVDKTNTEWWFDNYINKFHISHCNWSVSDFQASSAFSGGTNPSASGQIAQTYIKQTPDEFVPAWVNGLEGPAKDTVFSMPAPFHQTSRFNRYYGTHAESTSVLYSYRDKVDRRIPGGALTGYTVLKITPSTEDNWVTYFIKPTAATKYLHLRYHAKDGKGTVEILLNGAKAGQAVLASDTTWNYAIVPLDIAASSGTDTLKFNFVNTTGTSYLIEWFELTNSSVVTPVDPDVMAARNFFYRHRRPVLTCAGATLSITLPAGHPYTIYSIMSLDGRTVKTAPLSATITTIPINVCSNGLWLFRLDGPGTVELLKAMAGGQ
ncbi:MAG: glycoside hydrolase family 5 protein [Chitinispirillaceae bacterium]|nr:glycoside hydrolase family 5 protein [Chitinispirillaceae bacterium]